MIFGIDVSGATVDWAKVKASGIAFGIAKATEGNGYTQPQIAANLKGMRAAGIIPGAYHFLVSDFAGATGDVQCDYFLSRVGDPTDLIVALDVEAEPKLPQQPGIREVRAWINRFKSRYPNHPVLIYSGGWYWKSAHYMNNPTGSDLGPLWDSKYVYDTISKYKAPAVIYGYVPATWWTPGYGGWTRTSVLQFTAWPSVPGVSGSSDASAFLGTTDELRRLLISPSLPDTGTGDTMTFALIYEVDPTRDITFKAGVQVSILASLDPGAANTPYKPATASHAACDQLASVGPTSDGGVWYCHIKDGTFAGKWVRAATIDLADPVPAPPAPVTYTQAELDAKVAAQKAADDAALAAMTTRLTGVKTKTAAFAADVAND